MADLAIHVQEFVPSAEGAELEARIALLKMRDYGAMLRGRSDVGLAIDHAITAHEVAGDFVYAEVPTDRLKLAASYAQHLIAASLIAESLCLLDEDI